jgi:hypothetical protein
MTGQEPSNRTELAAGLGWTGLMLNAKPILSDIFPYSERNRAQALCHTDQ